MVSPNDGYGSASAEVNVLESIGRKVSKSRAIRQPAGVLRMHVGLKVKEKMKVFHCRCESLISVEARRPSDCSLTRRVQLEFSSLCGEGFHVISEKCAESLHNVFKDP
jgi:hypothetical protein